MNILLMLTTLFTVLFSNQEQNLILVNKTSDYAIIIPARFSPQEKEAAKILQYYIKRISNVELPIILDTASNDNKEIIIGNANRVNPIDINVDELGEDGFQIYTKEKKLYIVGGLNQGIINGTYTFLEEYLDCRMYTPEVQIVPETSLVVIPKVILNRQIPQLNQRYLSYEGTDNGEYPSWHKLTKGGLNGSDSEWGLSSESFAQLVPPSKYFKTHPEYYAFSDGKRSPSQLCLSNPEVLTLLVKNLSDRMEKKPKAVYWSVSQNDNWGFCQCENCSSIDKEEGSPSGSIIRFVNQVAKSFPDKIITTLAYMYSRNPPQRTKPLDNVMVMLSNIEINRSRAIVDDPLCKSFRNDLEGWARMTKNIFVWDYVIQFKNLISPFPNLRTLQPNLEYFSEQNVTSVFEQGNREVGGEFSELRSYLLAKLMWNPKANTDSLISDFTNGYYGKAGKFIKEYIDLIHDNLEKSNDILSIFGNTIEPKKTYLSSADLKIYNELFDKAEMEANHDSEILTRVKLARLPLRYVEIEQTRTNPFDNGSLFINKNGRYKVNKQFIDKINKFISFCKEHGITRLSEWHTTPDEYLEIIKSYTNMNFDGNFALGKTISISPDLLKSNSKATKNTLTDGIFGTNENSPLWIHTNEKSYEIIVELKERKLVRTVSAHFMNNNGSTVFLPSLVEFFISDDQVHFEKIGEKKGPIVVNEYGTVGSFSSGIKPIPKFYILDSINRNSSYIKIKITSIGDAPMWHPLVGAPVFTALDEIIIQ